MKKMKTNIEITYIQINIEKTMEQTTTVMPMKTQVKVAMVTLIQQLLSQILTLKIMDQMIAAIARTLKVLILMATKMVKSLRKMTALLKNHS